MLQIAAAAPLSNRVRPDEFSSKITVGDLWSRLPFLHQTKNKKGVVRGGPIKQYNNVFGEAA